MKFNGSWLSVGCRRVLLHRPPIWLVVLCSVAVSDAGSCFAQTSENFVEFESGNFRIDKAPEGGVIVELKSADSVGGGSVRSISEKIEVEFTDDGEGFDEEAKDGIYTGVVPGDIETEIKRYESLVEGLRRKDVLIPIFSGRELVEFRPGSHFIPKVDRALGKIPILEISAGTNVLIPNSIAITDLSVIEKSPYVYNPCTQQGEVGDVDASSAVWSFGHLMAELAAAEGRDAAEFCSAWLEHWTADQQINGYTAAARQEVYDAIISAWPVDPNDGSRLSVAEAPFRLLGIFNRIDLRKRSYTQGSSAGELRFVYCFTDGCSPNPRPFLVIFEYQVNKVGCEVREWGRQWAALSDLPLGSDVYLSELARLTTEVTDVYTTPRGHKLAQIRTNELIPPENSYKAQLVPDRIPDDPLPNVRDWELREFVIADVGLLTQKSVVATPDLSQESTAWLANAINTSGNPIPAFTSSDEAASSLNPVNFFWSAPGANDTRRHRFSLNTCNACHGRETDTHFTHVKPGPFGEPVELSEFLTGNWVADPVLGTPVRHFNDLVRRRQDLQNLIDASCVSQIFPVVRRNVAVPVFRGHLISH
jgi:hypothetical protein